MAPGAIFRKTDWQAVGGYDAALDTALEDYGLWLKLVHAGKTAHQLDEELAFYRVRPMSRSTTLAQAASLRRCIKALYQSCPSFFDKGACALLVRSHELQHQRAQLECLFSFKLFSPIFQLEKMIRATVKRLLGRVN